MTSEKGDCSIQSIWHAGTRKARQGEKAAHITASESCVQPAPATYSIHHPLHIHTHPHTHTNIHTLLHIQTHTHARTPTLRTCTLTYSLTHAHCPYYVLFLPPSCRLHLSAASGGFALICEVNTAAGLVLMTDL